MNPALKYFLGRLGLFVLCAIPAVLLFPDVNPLFTLLVAVLVSAALSFVLLRQWRDELADRMSANARSRIDEKERLRSALAGDDEPADEPPPVNGSDKPSGNSSGKPPASDG